MASKHLPYGGSTAKRTMACPGWVELAKAMPKKPSGEAADIGNLLHDAMEEYYWNNAEFKDLVGVLTYNGHVLTQEQVDGPLTSARKQMDALMDEFDIDEYVCEPFVELVPNLVGGSIDFIGVSADRKTVLVADYKFGGGYVNVFANEQLLFYSACAAATKKTSKFFRECENLVFAIVQPAINEAEASKYFTDMGEVAEFTSAFLERMKSKERKGGEHCQFCPGAPICPEQKSLAMSAVLMKPSTAKEVADTLKLVEQLQAWMKEVKDQSLSLATTGVQIPEFKLVRANTTRRYVEGAEPHVAALLGEQAYEKKLISFTKAIKLNPDVENFVEKPQGELVLVPETDKREAVTLTTPDRLTSLMANK